MLIALAGNKRSGKDTAASFLVHEYGYNPRAFAGALKNICSKVWKIPRQYFDHQEYKERLFMEPVVMRYTHLHELTAHAWKYAKFNTTDAQHKIDSQCCGHVCNTPRELLQFVGTEVFRNCVSKDFWLKALETSIGEKTHVVVSDVRLENEREWVRAKGGLLVLIKRPFSDQKDSHSSENNLGKDSEYDVVIQNDEDIEELYKKIAGLHESQSR